MDSAAPVREGQILSGPLFNEPMRVETIRENGLLDHDAYADVKSVREAMDRKRAPFYLRRTKEAMVYFPQRQADGEWASRPVFTKRVPRTTSFAIDGPEFELYQAVTRFVKRQSRRVAQDRRDCYWLYVVTRCATAPELQKPIKDPARFPWREVSKVQHYWLEVNAMTEPMKVREDPAPYGKGA